MWEGKSVTPSEREPWLLRDQRARGRRRKFWTPSVTSEAVVNKQTNTQKAHAQVPPGFSG